MALATSHTATVVFDSPAADGLLLKPGTNLRHGLRHFREHYGEPTSLEEDLLVVAAAVFACDLAFKRGEREEITRHIRLNIPVVNHAAFENIRDQLQYALWRLSHDAWDLSFLQRNGTPEASGQFEANGEGTALLFSGGLDSFAAAVRYGKEGETVKLVSHVTANQAVSSAQETLLSYLQAQFPSQFERIAFRVSGFNRAQNGFPFPSDSAREETQRTRSFLFLSLASLVARRSGIQEVVMIAENGQMAIHLPLTAARISAFSTHTAHPEFVAAMGPMMSTLLGYSIEITNPFLYMTKAEVVAEVVAHHSSQLEHAVSCWKASRVGGNYNHCGFCIPCLVRRIAIEVHGTSIPEYSRDLLIENVGILGPDDDGKRNLMELGEFVATLAVGSQASLEDDYPDLINAYIDPLEAVAMYKRFASEAQNVFARYPRVKDLLL